MFEKNIILCIIYPSPTPHPNYNVYDAEIIFCFFFHI